MHLLIHLLVVHGTQKLGYIVSKLSIHTHFLISRQTFQTEDPCLSVSWTDDTKHLLAGCIDNTIKSIDINTGQSINIGQHDGIVKDLHWLQAARTLCSLSADKTMRFWDLRQKNAVAKFDIGEKIFSSDMVFPNLLLGLSGEKILLINLPHIQRMFSKGSFEHIPSPLGGQTLVNSVALSPDGKSLGLGGNDGRIHLSLLKVNDSGSSELESKITYKSHYNGEYSRPEALFPVNALGFHPGVKSFLFTAGSEGKLLFWDSDARMKIKTLDYKPTAITKAKMSSDGMFIAYSLGYDWKGWS